MTEQEPYWVRHIRRHNQGDLTRIKNYPVEKIITIDVSKITDKSSYERLIESPLGQIDEINDQALIA